MNSKLMKVWGIVLTLALLSGLIMASVPVSAGDMAWTTLTKPVVTEMTTANVFDFAADGKTIYLASDNATGIGSILYKSTNAGLKWTAIDIKAGDNDILLDHEITKLVVSPKNSSYIFMTDGTDCYFSEDGGLTIEERNPPAGYTGNISDIDISYNSSGYLALLVASDKDIAYELNNRWYYTYSDAEKGDRGYLGNDNWNAAADTVLAAAFSPNFSDDNTIIAVVTLDTDVMVISYVFETSYEAEWNDTISRTYTVAENADRSAADKGYEDAEIAFPDDFDGSTSSYLKAFIALIDDDGESAIYRFTGKTGAKNKSILTDLKAESGDINCIAFKGATSSGTLAVAGQDESNIYTCESASSDDSPEWVSCEQMPRYQFGEDNANTHLAFSPVTDLLYAGTDGAPGSAFSVSVGEDYLAFVGIGMISVSDLDNTVLPFGGNTGIPGATQWQKVDDTTTAYNSRMMFKSVDSGATWQLVFDSKYYDNDNFNGQGFSIYLSPAFATDSTIYLHESGDDFFFKSTDGGYIWNKIKMVNSEDATAFTAIDGTNYRLATTEGYRTSNNAEFVELDGSKPLAIIGLPGCLLVWELNGNWWYSTDDGATFTETEGDEDVGFTTKFTFGFDGKNWTVYEADMAGNAIYYYTIGKSESWEILLDENDFTMNDKDNPIAGKISGIAKAGAELWYIATDDNGGANDVSQLWRTTDLKNYEPIPGTKYNTTNGSIKDAGSTLMTVTATGTGAQTIYLEFDGKVSTTAYANKYMALTDTLLVTPKILSPVADAKIENNVTTVAGTKTLVDISWERINDADKYELDVTYDPEFKNHIDTGDYSFPKLYTGTSAAQIPLTPGTAYYTRVRVAPNQPLSSFWSAGVKFNTSTSSSVSGGLDTEGRIYPTQGALITKTSLTFTWGTVPGADTYEIKVLKNGVEVASQTGLTTTVYTMAKLDADASYTWSVRAVSSGIASDWVTSAFTTATPAPAATGTTGGGTQQPAVTPIVTVTAAAPAQPQPTVVVNVTPTDGGTTGTPAWAWIVIAIGAVLVIAVIVLIVRTRKV